MTSIGGVRATKRATLSPALICELVDWLHCHLRRTNIDQQDERIWLSVVIRVLQGGANQRSGLNGVNSETMHSSARAQQPSLFFDNIVTDDWDIVAASRDQYLEDEVRAVQEAKFC